MSEVRKLTFLPQYYFNSFSEHVADVPEAKKRALGNISAFY